MINQLAEEIQRAFPGVSGFSRPNIYRMRAFYLAYPVEEGTSAIVSQPVRQFGVPVPASVPDLPWGHIVTLQRLKDSSLRAWYARAAVEGGWSRAVLVTQIDTRRDRVVVEYALRDVQNPIGVAEWETRLVTSLPQELEGALPTVEALEAELGGASTSEGDV